MAEFNSEIQIIPYSQKEVFGVLSDLNCLELAKDNVSEERREKLKGFTSDKDSCSISVDPVGELKFVVVERQADSLIRLEAEKTPFPLSMSILINKISDNETELKVTADAELNAFLKPMVAKPLQSGLNKMVEILACIPFDKANNKEATTEN